MVTLLLMWQTESAPVFLSVLLRTLISSWGPTLMTTSKPNSFQRPTSQYHYTGVGLQHSNLEGTQSSIHNIKKPHKPRPHGTLGFYRRKMCFSNLLSHFWGLFHIQTNVWHVKYSTLNFFLLISNNVFYHHHYGIWDKDPLCEDIYRFLPYTASQDTGGRVYLWLATCDWPESRCGWTMTGSLNNFTESQTVQSPGGGHWAPLDCDRTLIWFRSLLFLPLEGREGGRGVVGWRKGCHLHSLGLPSQNTTKWRGGVVWTTEISCLTVAEARSLKPRCQQGHAPLEGAVKDLLWASLQASAGSLSHDNVTPAFEGCLPCLENVPTLCLSLCPHLF